MMKKIFTKTTQMLGDTITPVDAYLKIRDLYRQPILLESNDFQNIENCNSFLCLEPISTFKLQDEKISIEDEFGIKTIKPINSNINIINELNSYIKDFKFDKPNSIANAFFGFNSYESARYFESIDLQPKEDSVAIPILQYDLYRYVIAFNNLKNEITIYENTFEEELSGTENLIHLLQNKKTPNYSFSADSEKSNVTDEEYMKMVDAAIKHCFRGDVFQLVLSRRFTQNFKGDEFNVYRHLRSINPSPYLFYFDYGNFKIFGSSPETQIEINNGKAYINPIAGTYPRTKNCELDQNLAAKLLEDPKENAEHIMLVDLSRNDLSKYCKNVKVEKLKEIKYYSHLIHLVSIVSGELQDKESFTQVIADTFPAGTLTGAPKHKAMQLINKYENISRSFYGGSIGYINQEGIANQAIMIRTFLSKNHQLHYQAGAGIVSLSDRNNELNEVNNKLMALKTAIKKANKNNLNNIL